MGINEVRAIALALSDEERAQLADELLDSLHPAPTDADELEHAIAQRIATVRDGSATLHDISVATDTLARMVAERKR